MSTSYTKKEGTMKTILVAEFNDIPKGMKNLDSILKRGNIEVYRAGVTCPGKYYFIVYGDNEDINYCVEKIEKQVKFEVISGVSNKVIEILGRNKNKVFNDTIGVVEFFTISESVKTLDMILKNIPVEVIKLVLGSGIAGKSYFVVTGNTSSIIEMVNQLGNTIRYKSCEIINNPEEGLLKFI